MTALCGGGASTSKFGAQAVVDVTSTWIGLQLAEAGASWLNPAIALLTLPPLIVSNFCSTDPPAQPTFTTAERDALLNLTVGADLLSGLVKFGDLVFNMAWFQLCQCSSVATPAAPAPNAPPSGTPFPIVVQAAAQQICGTIGPTTTTDPVTAIGNNAGAFFYSTYPTRQFFRIHAIRVPVGIGPHEPETLTIFWGLNGSPVRNDTVATFPPDGAWHTFDFAFDVDFDEVNAIGVHAAHDSTDTWGLYTEIFCGPSGSSTCCGPDETTNAILRVLLGQVNLIQRQLAPFAYVHGTVHTGISGNGQLAVSGLLGVAVDVTTLPARAGRTSGDPDQLYDVGWINVGTADGFGPRQFISSNPFILRPVPGDMTLIGYSIPADVVVTITELVREP